MKTLQQIEKEIDSIIADPTNSYWLKIQLRTRLSLDQFAKLMLLLGVTSRLAVMTRFAPGIVFFYLIGFAHRWIAFSSWRRGRHLT